MVRGKNQLVALIVVAAVAILAFVYRGIWFKETPPYMKHVGEAVADARLTRLDETTIQLSELLAASKPGEKTILSFWATWCDPCIRELPVIQKKRADYEKAGVRILLVNYDGPLPDKSIPEVKAWLISQRLSLDTYFDFGEELLKTLSAEALPFVVGLDAERKVSWLTLGEIDWANEREVLGYFK